jgi:hypothetical protein
MAGGTDIRIKQLDSEDEEVASRARVEPANVKPNPYLEVTSLASLRNLERQQRRRELNTLVSRLDGMLPQTFLSRATAHGAGGRALGSRGRSLHDVLKDSIHLVRERLGEQHRSKSARGRGKGSPAGAPNVQALPASTGPVDSSQLMRDSLLSTQGVFCVELRMPDWHIVRLSAGAQAFFQHAPWGGGSGQSFLHAFVHTEDVSLLKNMLEELNERSGTARQGSGQVLGKRSRGEGDRAIAGPFGASMTSHIRVLRCFLSDPVDEGAGEGGRFRASEFVSLELQMVVPPSRPDGMVASLLLMAPLSSALVVAQGPIPSVSPEECSPCRMHACELGAVGHRADLLEAMRAVSGVYEWDNTGILEGAISPGAMRAANNGVIGRQELTLLQRTLGAVGGWCMQSLTDFLYTRLQIHFHLSVNDDGRPMVRVHTRLKMAQNFVSRWRMATQIRLDGTPSEFENWKHHAHTVLSIGILNFDSQPVPADGCATASSIGMGEGRAMHGSGSARKQESSNRCSRGHDSGHAAAGHVAELHVLRFSLRHGGQPDGAAGGGGSKRPARPEQRGLLDLSGFDVYKSPTWYSWYFRGGGGREDAGAGASGCMKVAGIHPVSGERMVSLFKRVGDADMALFAWDDDHHDDKLALP